MVTVIPFTSQQMAQVQMLQQAITSADAQIAAAQVVAQKAYAALNSYLVSIAPPPSSPYAVRVQADTAGQFLLVTAPLTQNIAAPVQPAQPAQPVQAGASQV
jgi:hypothetical protein